MINWSKAEKKPNKAQKFECRYLLELKLKLLQLKESIGSKGEKIDITFIYSEPLIDWEVVGENPLKLVKTKGEFLLKIKNKIKELEKIK